MKTKIIFLLAVLSFVFLTIEKLSAAELKILKPNDRGKAYDIAAEEFQKFYEQCTGRKVEITTQANEVDDFVVIGSDAVNRFCRDLIEKKKLKPFRIRTGMDDYQIHSLRDDDRNFLFLAGGRGRSTLYAVYHFFETRGGCSYFWDGDVIPKSETLDITGLDIHESPRFEYRGLRYFAHRSLHRFQAEHWGPEDWEKEVDWIVKKRLNVFMLRIGMDDVFQKAFPEVVPYPDNDKPIPEAIPGGYDERTPSWSLKYRGELRKHILDYAFDRDLMHPEDFGTMTHWYSRTPNAFIEHFKPNFLYQPEGGYMTEKSGLVWDIRDDKMLDLYFKLTEAHIEHYGKPELFHTIGLAERRMFKNAEENLEIKLHTYRRLIAKLREKYPQASLLLGGWDLYNTWKPEEVPALLRELDPEKTIIWDYEADTITNNNFTNWDVVGKFPYTFGIFEALEAAADIRANYDVIEKRIAVAANDPFCKGYIFWPEMSHADILMLEYFPHNAWKPDQPGPMDAVERLCRTRYRDDGPAMLNAWKIFLPCTYPYPGEAWDPAIIWGYRIPGNFFSQKRDWGGTRKKYAERLVPTPELYRTLSELPFTDEKPFVKRDLIDLARTPANKLTILAICNLNLSLKNWREGKGTKGDVLAQCDLFLEHLELFRDALSLHEDYSMNTTFERLKTVSEVNPHFAKTLVHNAANGYCMSYQHELFDHFYIPTATNYIQAVRNLLNEDNKEKAIDLDALTKFNVQAFDDIHKKTVVELKSTSDSSQRRYRDIMLKLAKTSAALLDFSP